MSNYRVLFDGWPFVYAANSAGAIHLRTLIELLSEHVDCLMALPAPVEGLDAELGIESVIVPSKDLGEWQQKELQKSARSNKASLIHSTMMGASLFGRVPTLISPSASFNPEDYPSRLKAAQSEGGMERAHLLWPADLPEIKAVGQHRSMGPAIHPDFLIEKEHPLPTFAPEDYLLVHGPLKEHEIKNLLESWTWAAASIGESYPIAMIGISPQQAEEIETLLPQYHLEEFVQILPQMRFQEIVALYQHCSAVLLMEDSYQWGASARLALASGKAIVGQAKPEADHLLGDAAYLVKDGDLRKLGAAIITSIVDEGVWEKLEEGAKAIAKRWNADEYRKSLLEIYGEIA